MEEAPQNKISTRSAKESDTEFARIVHHAAYHAVIEKQFGTFNEAEQDEFFSDAWNPTEHQIILFDGLDAGYCFIKKFPDHIFIHELVLLPEYQGKGIGSKILTELLEIAKVEKIPVRLQVLKSNPAQSLYMRLGFKKIDETDTHFKMEYLPQ